MMLRKRRPEPPKSNWYLDASPEDRQEYDAFGPWIQLIRGPGDMPRRFQAWGAACQGARFLCKVPENVDRRDARPGQDLYRAVLAVHEDRVCYLNWNGTSVTVSEAPREQICAIELSQCLLLGELRILMTDGSAIDVAFNTVSQPLIEKVVDDLRPSVPAEEASSRPEPAVKNYHFENLKVEHKTRDPRCRLVFCDEPGSRYADARGRRRFSPGLLILDNGTEFTLITQGQGARSRMQAQFGYRCLHLPRRAFTGFRVLPRTTPRGAQSLLVEAEGHSFEFPVLGDPVGLISSSLSV